MKKSNLSIILPIMFGFFVMGFVDIPNVSENNLLNCCYEIKNILVKPNSEEQHSIYVEIEFEICCDASDTIEIESIQDMYCPIGHLKFKQKNINKMIAFSSAAQIGYIYMGIGSGVTIGLIAAFFHILSHATTKTLLFLTSANLFETAKKFIKMGLPLEQIAEGTGLSKEVVQQLAEENKK